MEYYGSKFYLDKKDKNGFYTIMMYIGLGYDKVESGEGAIYKNNRLRYSTGEKIKKRYWDEKKGQPRNLRDDEAAEELQKSLDALAKKVEGIKKDARRKNIKLSKDYFKSLFHSEEKKKQISLIERLDDYINSNKNTRREGTIKKNKQLKAELLDFAEKTKVSLAYHEIDRNWVVKYFSFLIEEYDNSNKTIEGKFSKLKAFIHYAIEQKDTDNREIEKVKINDLLTLVKKTIIWINEDELLHLNAFDFSKNPRYDHIRDVFCFGCYTGLRYSDLAQLSEQHLVRKGKSVTAINLTTHKGSNKAVIPIVHPNALKILKKYHGKLTGSKCLPVLTNQESNSILKEMAKAAELNSKIEVVRFQGVNRIADIVLKHQVLTMHSSRHSFACISLINGMDITTLQELLQHTDIEDTMRYLEITDEFKKNAMNKAWNNKK